MLLAIVAVISSTLGRIVVVTRRVNDAGTKVRYLVKTDEIID